MVLNTWGRRDYSIGRDTRSGRLGWSAKTTFCPLCTSLRVMECSSDHPTISCARPYITLETIPHYFFRYITTVALSLRRTTNSPAILGRKVFNLWKEYLNFHSPAALVPFSMSFFSLLPISFIFPRMQYIGCNPISSFFHNCHTKMQGRLRQGAPFFTSCQTYGCCCCFCCCCFCGSATLDWNLPPLPVSYFSQLTSRKDEDKYENWGGGGGGCGDELYGPYHITVFYFCLGERANAYKWQSFRSLSRLDLDEGPGAAVVQGHRLNLPDQWHTTTSSCRVSLWCFDWKVSLPESSGGHHPQCVKENHLPLSGGDMWLGVDPLQLRKTRSIL